MTALPFPAADQHHLIAPREALVLQGGTPLRARASWPPPRASVDVDLEWDAPEETRAALK